MFTLLRTDFEDFKSFVGKHKINLDLPAGTYFLTGKNLDNPRMGANACGKSSISDGIYWCFTGEMMDLKVPGAETEPWEGTKRSSVTTWFEIDDQYYGLRRQRRPIGLFLKEGEQGEWRKIDQQEIRQLLGLPNETLKRTILLGQRQPMFLDLSPTEQSKFFSDILSLDLWMEAAKLAGERATEAQRKARQYQDEWTRLNSRFETLGHELESQIAEEATWQEQQKAQHARATEALEKAEEKLTEAERTLASTTKPAALEEATNKLQNKITDKVNQRTKTMRTESTTKQAHGVLLKSVRDRETELERLTEAKKTRVCPECGQMVKLKHLTDKIMAMRPVLENDRRIIKEGEVALNSLNNEIADLDDEIEQLQANLSPQLRKHREAVDLYVNKERDVRDGKDNVTRLTRERAKLNTTNPHTATIDRLTEQLRTAKIDAQAAADDSDGARSRAELATELERIFKEIRLQLIDEVLAELQVTVGEYAEQLGLVGWRIKFTTEKELKSGGTAVALTTMLYPPGIEKGINWKVYSGGEKQRWLLAITFGLSEVLLARAGLDCNVEILDEPSESTSAEGVADLIEHINERARQSNKAIFYVDHHILDRGQFDHVWTVIRENGRSRIEINQ